VHHGIFWRNEPLVIDRRLRGRLEALFAANLTLAAYHLALDAHPELGNNALLADLLGAKREGEFAGIGAGARFAEPVTIDELATRLRKATEREPLVFAEGPEQISRVAVVTGGGGTRGTTRSSRASPRSRHCTPPESSGSISSQAATTRPRRSASGRSQRG
jgi:putative NIF3 family GTP cyclohydrolase 1 type 2